MATDRKIEKSFKSVDEKKKISKTTLFCCELSVWSMISVRLDRFQIKRMWYASDKDFSNLNEKIGPHIVKNWE